MELKYRDDSKETKPELIRESLLKYGVLTTIQVHHLHFRNKAKQGCQAVLTKLRGTKGSKKKSLDNSEDQQAVTKAPEKREKDRLIEGFPISSVPGFEHKRMLVHHLPRYTPPRKELGHRIGVNQALVMGEILQRATNVPARLIFQHPDYEMDRPNGSPVPVSDNLEIIPHGSLIPDITMLFEHKGFGILWYIEIDMGSEPIASWAKGVLIKECILSKILCYQELLGSGGFRRHEQDNLPIKAVQVVFVFMRPRRMHEVHKRLLKHLGKPRKSVWMTVMDNLTPDKFWTDRHFIRLEENPQPFAVFESENQMTRDFLPEKSKKTNQPQKPSPLPQFKPGVISSAIK